MTQMTNRTLKRALCVLAVIAGTPLLTRAQSATRYGTSAQPTTTTSNASNPNAVGSSSRATEMPIGLQGYCPVCLVDMKQWVKGDARISFDYDGRKYLFPATEQLEKFQRDPSKYAPVLNGDDIVQFARTGKRVAGELNQGAIHDGRVYFFATAENKKLFQTIPDAYINADLALGGECVVCRVDMKKRVAGSPKIATTNDGLRYLFPGEEQRAAFLASPAHYIEAFSGAGTQRPAGSTTRMSAPSQQSEAGSGTR